MNETLQLLCTPGAGIAVTIGVVLAYLINRAPSRGRNHRT